MFRVCGQSPERSSARQPSKPSGDFFQLSSRSFKGCCLEVLCVGASSPPLSVAMLHSSQPPHRAPRTTPVLRAGAGERGASSVAVKNMTSAVSVTMSLMQVPSGIAGSAATIAFVTWYQRFGSATNRLRSAVFGVSLVLSLFLQFD